MNAVMKKFRFGVSFHNMWFDDVEELGAKSIIAIYLVPEVMFQRIVFVDSDLTDKSRYNLMFSFLFWRMIFHFTMKR